MPAPSNPSSPSVTAAKDVPLDSSFVRNTFTLSDGQPREFFWGCVLTKENPTVTWNFDEEEDKEDLDYIQHTLFLRTAVLGVGAKEGQRCLIQAETKNFAQKEVVTAIASLSLGRNDMCNLDMNFIHEIPVTLRLVEGDGPVHLSGLQLVEIPTPVEDDEELQSEVSFTEVSTMEDTEEDVDDSPKASKKRKGSKRGKMDSNVDSDENEDDEEEDEEEEEEDEDEEEAEEEEEDEESMEEESPVAKKKAKKAAAKKQPTAKELKAKMKAAKPKPKAKGKAK